MKGGSYFYYFENYVDTKGLADKFGKRNVFRAALFASTLFIAIHRRFLRF